MTLQELDSRTNDNLRVTLLWRADNNTLVVKVDDGSDPDKNVLIEDIPPADAKQAFLHPYGYYANNTPRWSGTARELLDDGTINQDRP